jgi:hypothetical protein
MWLWNASFPTTSSKAKKFLFICVNDVFPNKTYTKLGKAQPCIPCLVYLYRL